MLKWPFQFPGFRSWTDPFVKLILCHYHVKLFYRVDVLRVYCSVNHILGRGQVDAPQTIHNTLPRMSSASFWCSVCVFSVILAFAAAAPPDRTKGKFNYRKFFSSAFNMKPKKMTKQFISFFFWLEAYIQKGSVIIMAPVNSLGWPYFRKALSIC